MTTRVSAYDLLSGERETVDVTDNYVLIREGSAYVASTHVHRLKDGTVTHVITVKGCKQ